MTGSPWQSGFVASLFALHPLNVESVVWAVERKNVLSGLFWMLTLWSYARYVERPTIRRYLLVLTVFALGLMSKPTLVTLPFVLLLLDYWPLLRLQLVRSGGQPDQPPVSSTQPGSGTSIAFRLVREKVPFFTLAAVAIVLTVLSNLYLGSMVITGSASGSLRIGNALISYMGYVGKMMWPSKLAIYYPPPETIVWWQVTAAVLFLMIVSLVAIRTVKTRPYLAVGWLWYLGTLVPTIGLVRAGLWPAMADRFAYVPLIGLFIMVAWGVPEFLAQHRIRKTILPVAAGMVLLALVVATRTQIAHWRNSIFLFEQAIEVDSDNHVAHKNLALSLAKVGRFTEAYDHARKALRIVPENSDAITVMGLIHAMEGRTYEAAFHFEKAIKIDSSNDGAHYNLGVALVKLGKMEKAIRHYNEVLRLKPDKFEARVNLAGALLQLARNDEAILHLNKAVQQFPESLEARHTLAISLAELGRIDEAIEHFSYLVERYNMPEALHGLGISLIRKGKIEEAIGYFSRAMQMRPDVAEFKRSYEAAVRLKAEASRQ
jgi:tetratricopeptide (TPR) repeat protein